MLKHAHLIYDTMRRHIDTNVHKTESKRNMASCNGKRNILRKTIEGYGFCFDFIPKGIIFSTQIVNRYVAEPSLCKDSIKFSRCLEALLADLQK